MASQTSAHWKSISWVCAGLLAAVLMTAWLTRLWVLTALPVGFLFGFFLQRGDLCGSSAFSEVLLLRDRSKVYGLWILIVVSMLGFALLDVLDLVQLAPKQMLWLSYLVGGVVFGAGTVLAGGCISGCLYKTGTGNLNSMAALVGIPLGIGAVQHGSLAGVHAALRSHKVTGPEGVAVTFSSLTGLPFWLLALLCGAATLAVVLAGRRRAAAGRSARGAARATGATHSAGAESAAAGACGPAVIIADPSPQGANRPPWLQRVLTRPWRPWQAGLMIGLLAGPAYLSSAASGRNYPLGVTNGVLHMQQLLIDSQKRVVWWLVLVVAALVLGAWVAGRLSGQARLLPKPPEQTVTAFVGGILVGMGAAFANGCVVGNIMSGLALMSAGMVIFTAATILANWLVTWLYLMGGAGK
jgi:hypothetical protein